MLDLDKSNSITPISRVPELSEMRRMFQQSHWFDPFSSVNQVLVCRSTEKVAPPKIQQDLLAAKAVGEKTYEIFRIE